jgi:deoxyribodipyrimidine photo-lyase
VEKRMRIIREGELGEGPVVYWMNRDQRARDNWALLAAQKYALEQRKPLHVLFCLTPSYLHANKTMYSFMIHGLERVRDELASYNIPLCILSGAAPLSLPQTLEDIKAAALFTDFNPLRIKKEWIYQITEQIHIPFYEVDAHNIIPCWTASPKREYTARAFRSKINKLLPSFLTNIPPLLFHPYSQTIETDPFQAVVEKVFPHFNNIPSLQWTPGTTYGMKKLEFFLQTKISQYSTQKNNPTVDCLSGLSPYLHFGHISPQRVAYEVISYKGEEEIDTQSREDFLEELIVRRELADNFCFYTDNYDTFDAFPDWAKNTLNKHRFDPRPYFYSLELLEQGETHDPLWNAAQKDMCIHGKLHSWLRMYWAKKILEWSPSPEEALKRAIYLNDHYEIDGRDPNGYTGIAWSIGGVHDRPWPERPIFGKIRYMNEKGAYRKFHVKHYIDSVTILNP